MRILSALPTQVHEAFSASGTVHLLAVSGFHVAAVYGAGFFLLRDLIKQVRFRLLGHASGWPRPTELAATCALLVVMGYACLVTLDGLVDLVDPNFPRSGNGLPRYGTTSIAVLVSYLRPGSVRKSRTSASDVRLPKPKWSHSMRHAKFSFPVTGRNHTRRRCFHW